MTELDQERIPQGQQGFISPLIRGATALLVAGVSIGCNSLVAQARDRNSFRLMHMPRGNHAQSIASNGGLREDYYSGHNFDSTVSFGM